MGIGASRRRGRKGKDASVRMDGERVVWTDEENMAFDVSEHSSDEKDKDVPGELLLNAQGFSLSRDVLAVVAAHLRVKDLLRLRAVSRGLCQLCTEALSLRGVFAELRIGHYKSKLPMLPPKDSLPVLAERLRSLTLDNDRIPLDQLERWIKAAEKWKNLRSLNVQSVWKFCGKNSRSLCLLLSKSPLAAQLEHFGVSALSDETVSALDLSAFVNLRSLLFGRTYSARDKNLDWDFKCLLKSPGSRITALSFYRVTILPEHVGAFVQHFPNLDNVQYEDISPNSDSLLAACVAHYDMLQSFAFRSYPSLYPMQLLERKRFIHMTEFEGYIEGLELVRAFVSTMPNLRSLNFCLSGRVAGDWKPCFPWLAELCPKLEILRTTSYMNGKCINAADADYSSVENWRSLKVLRFASHVVNNLFFYALSRAAPPLEEIEFHVAEDESSRAAFQEFLRNCPKLKHISMSCEIDGPSLAALGHCKSLQSLSAFGGERILDEHMISFAKGCRNLTLFFVDRCSQVTEIGWMSFVRSCRDIEMVGIDGASFITDACIVELAKHSRKLLSLAVNYCPLLTNVSLRALHFYARNLEEFRAGATQMDDQLARKWTTESGRKVSAKADFYD